MCLSLDTATRISESWSAGCGASPQKRTCDSHFTWHTDELSLGGGLDRLRARSVLKRWQRIQHVGHPVMYRPSFISKHQLGMLFNVCFRGSTSSQWGCTACLDSHPTRVLAQDSDLCLELCPSSSSLNCGPETGARRPSGNRLAKRAYTSDSSRVSMAACRHT